MKFIFKMTIALIVALLISGCAGAVSSIASKATTPTDLISMGGLPGAVSVSDEPIKPVEVVRPTKDKSKKSKNKSEAKNAESKSKSKSAAVAKEQEKPEPLFVKIEHKKIISQEYESNTSVLTSEYAKSIELPFAYSDFLKLVASQDTNKSVTTEERGYYYHFETPIDKGKPNRTMLLGYQYDKANIDALKTMLGQQAGLLEPIFKIQVEKNGNIKAEYDKDATKALHEKLGKQGQNLRLLKLEKTNEYGKLILKAMQKEYNYQAWFSEKKIRDGVEFFKKDGIVLNPHDHIKHLKEIVSGDMGTEWKTIYNKRFKYIIDPYPYLVKSSIELFDKYTVAASDLQKLIEDKSIPEAEKFDQATRTRLENELVGDLKKTLESLEKNTTASQASDCKNLSNKLDKVSKTLNKHKRFKGELAKLIDEIKEATRNYDFFQEVGYLILTNKDNMILDQLHYLRGVKDFSTQFYKEVGVDSMRFYRTGGLKKLTMYALYALDKDTAYTTARLMKTGASHHTSSLSFISKNRLLELRSLGKTLQPELKIAVTNTSLLSKAIQIENTQNNNLAQCISFETGITGQCWNEVKNYAGMWGKDIKDFQDKKDLTARFGYFETELKDIKESIGVETSNSNNIKDMKKQSGKKKAK